MASASPLKSDSAAGTQQRSEVPSAEHVLRPAVEFVGFWTAVLVPFALLALVTTGQAAQSPTLAFGLVGVNLLGLLLGRSYKR